MMTAAAKWARQNLFSSWGNTLLTIVAVSVIYLIGKSVIEWAIIDAVFTGTNRDACLVPGAGACWPYVGAKWNQFIYGRYPLDSQWRIDLIFVLGAAALIPALIDNMPKRGWFVLFLLVPFPIITYFLLTGGVFGLTAVPSDMWGGLVVTLIVAVSGIVASLPLGILLALGRQSDLPMIKAICIVFIEFWRGVPLITVLFMASVMLPLFLPDGLVIDKLLRCLIGVALFASAYMAEVIRGGLQALPKGQTEGAQALGLSYWQSMRLIILPQALRLVIPGIVNTFIGLFKDTTLVLIIGLFDLLGVIQLTFTDAGWSTPQTHNTGYAVAAIIFWVFCFAMSRYSQRIEQKLAVGRNQTGAK